MEFKHEPIMLNECIENLNIKKDGISHVIRILFTRYAVTISFAAIAFFCLPFPLQIRQALVLAFLSPIASACPAYTDALGEDYELSSTINSISMLISIGLITVALMQDFQGKCNTLENK